jgi:hypothetical protein
VQPTPLWAFLYKHCSSDGSLTVLVSLCYNFYGLFHILLSMWLLMSPNNVNIWMYSHSGNIVLQGSILILSSHLRLITQVYFRLKCWCCTISHFSYFSLTFTTSRSACHSHVTQCLSQSRHAVTITVTSGSACHSHVTPCLSLTHKCLHLPATWTLTALH